AAAAAAAAPAASTTMDHLPVVNKFSIRFNDGDELVLHGGELLKGSILVELNEKTTLQAVKVQIKGRAAWLGDGQAKAEYEKVYFNQDMTLLERPPGRPEKGHFPWNAHYLYTLPFECPIPKGCPSSYESPFGSVRYYVKATLIEEDDSGQRGVTKEHYVKAAFSLLSPWDRLLPSNGEPVTVSDADFYGKCCCKGKLAADLSLSKSVFVPGEDVFGSIKLNGKKPKNILDQIEVRLVDRVLRVGTPEKMGASPYRTLVSSRLDRSDKSKSGGDAIDGVYFLTIPSVAPSTKGNFDEETGEPSETLAPNGLTAKQFPGIMESPSTATLRFRRAPFLRIQYAVQVSIGGIIILDAPITIAELSHTGSGDAPLCPFVVGSQPIEESSDVGKTAFGGPFSYTPMYPVKGGVKTQEEKTPIDNGISAMSPVTSSNVVTSPIKQEQAGGEERREDAGAENVGGVSPPPPPVSLSPVSVHAEDRREEEERERTPSPDVQVRVEEPVTKTAVRTEEHVEEVKNEEGEVVGTITTKTTTTQSSTTQVVEMSGSGEEAVHAIGERLADGWGEGGEEGGEGVESVEQSSSVAHGEDGEVIATTTTTKILKRVKREVGQEDEEEGEKGEVKEENEEEEEKVEKKKEHTVEE
ncbi:hypothetical protein PFISCL1PPCAC_23493, partial [Pristionchus fissidentatus]